MPKNKKVRRVVLGTGKLYFSDYWVSFTLKDHGNSITPMKLKGREADGKRVRLIVEVLE